MLLPRCARVLFGWLLCVVWPLAAAQGHDILYSSFFLSINSTAKATPRLSPARSSPVARPPELPPHCQSRLNLIVVCICWISSHLRPRPHPSLSLFFAPIAAQNDRKESLPRVPPVRISYPTFLPPPTPPFGWLLRHPVKWRPSKVDAPPTSLFFDGCHFGAQNKGKESGENEPRPPAPA